MTLSQVFRRIWERHLKRIKLERIKLVSWPTAPTVHMVLMLMLMLMPMLMLMFVVVLAVIGVLGQSC